MKHAGEERVGARKGKVEHKREGVKREAMHGAGEGSVETGEDREGVEQKMEGV